jgi:hypothetical protein
MDEAEIRWFLEKDYARLVNAMTILGGSPPPPRMRCRRRWGGRGS